MKTFLILASLIVALTLQAAPLVYTLQLSLLRTGNGKVTRTALSGWIVSGDGRLIVVKVDASRKRFVLQEPTDWRGKIVSNGPRGVTVLAVDGQEELSGLRGKGINNKVTIADSGLVPTILTLSGSEPWTLLDQNGENPIEYLDEFSGTIVFDKVRTERNFNNHLDADATVSALKAELISKGYIQE